MTRRAILGGAVLFVVGTAVGVLVGSSWASHRPTQWIQLHPPAANKSGLTFSDEAFLQADIPFPDVTRTLGRVKFLPIPGKRSDDFMLGYVIDVTVTSLDLSKVPKKYLQDRPVAEGKLTQLAIKQVSYEAVLEFQLLDADGFMLKKVESSPESIWSGRNNHLQGTIVEPISPDIVLRTRSATLQIGLQKCQQCEGS